MQIEKQMIAEIATEVLARLRAQMQEPQSSLATFAPRTVSRDGVFETVDEAASAAYEAQKQVAAMSRSQDPEAHQHAVCAERGRHAQRCSQQKNGLVHH